MIQEADPSTETKEAESREAHSTHGADRPPSSEETAAAERSRKHFADEQDSVAENVQSIAETGAKKKARAGSPKRSITTGPSWRSSERLLGGFLKRHAEPCHALCEHPAHLHLAHSDSLGNFRLGELFDEAQLDELLLALGIAALIP